MTSHRDTLVDARARITLIYTDILCRMSNALKALEDSKQTLERLQITPRNICTEAKINSCYINQEILTSRIHMYARLMKTLDQKRCSIEHELITYREEEYNQLIDSISQPPH